MKIINNNLDTIGGIIDTIEIHKAVVVRLLMKVYQTRIKTTYGSLCKIYASLCKIS